ncbi:MAG: serine acetyltransferase [Pseudomonadota bacterium]|nr:serine acetyltransferase [Pseudomonadota bacterium]
MRTFSADLKRHRALRERVTVSGALRLLWEDYGLQALLAYRLGRWAVARRPRPFWWPVLAAALPVYFLASRYVRLVYGIRLDLSADIGPGLYIGHFGNIWLRNCRLGAGCSISQSSRVGPACPGGKGPEIGDRVWIGAHAQVIGDIRVGDGCTVSAASVLTRDLVDQTLCMGNPARAVLRGYDNTRMLNPD